jgi:hypothetical protein
MMIILPILLLLLVPLGMTILHLTRPGFRHYWWIACASALITWPVILLAGLQLPLTIPLVSWDPDALFPSWPVLLVDAYAWPYAAALATLVLAVILTEVGRAAEADWFSWAASLGLAGLGILSVLSGNPLTVLLTWTAIDLAELLILMRLIDSSEARERVVVAFTGRVLGSGLLVVALLVTQAAGETLSLAVISPRASLLVLFAAGLRLGVLPYHLPFLVEPPLRRGLGTLIRLVPAAAGLVLLGRTAVSLSSAPVTPPLSNYLLALTGLAAMFSGLVWVFADDELAGRPAWLLGVASLAVASALRGQPSASLAWGLAGLFSGGLLFLSSARDRRLTWLTLLGFLGFSALPYTPTWEGARLFSAPFNPLLLLCLVSHALLLFGYAWHTFRPGRPLTGIERWVWLIYPLGLALLPVTHFAFGLRNNLGVGPMPVAGWWVGAASLGLVGIGVLWSERGPQIPRQPFDLLRSIFSLNWLYTGFWAFYRSFGRLITFLTVVFEGEGGVLWALLVLVLFVSLLFGNGGG